MQVQPYFPVPEVVAGNVASAPYDARLRFIRKLADRHLLMILGGTGIASVLVHWVPESIPPFWTDVILLVVSLLIASGLRKLGPGRGPDKLSQLFIPIVVVLAARLAGALMLLGIDVWPVPVASLATWLYARLCGRDFSFVGQFVLSLLFTLGLIIGAGLYFHRPYVNWGTGLPIAILWLSYLTYDSAALLQRRRPNEVWMAVLDLFRDTLNFISYTFKVIHHWRTFRI